MINYPIAIPSGSNITPYVSGTNNIGYPAAAIANIYTNDIVSATGVFQSLTSTSITSTNITGVNISANSIYGNTVTFGNNINVSGVNVLGLANSATLDFGSRPTINATFIISGTSTTANNNVLIHPSATWTPGRTADDWYWDSITLSAFAGSGTITVYAKVENGSTVMGTRNILFTVC